MAIKVPLANYKKVALDSMIFIYYFEGSSFFEQKLDNLFSKIESGEINAVTTVITLSELLVKPLAKNNIELADEYKNILNSFPHLRLLAIGHYLATLAANFKAKYKIKLPDALQVAGAIVANCDLFLSNDKELKKVEEIKVLTLSEL